MVVIGPDYGKLGPLKFQNQISQGSEPALYARVPVDVGSLDDERYRLLLRHPWPSPHPDDEGRVVAGWRRGALSAFVYSLSDPEGNELVAPPK